MSGAADIWPDGPERAPRAGEPDALVVDVEGFEGPLDLLLTLARTQKVDLARISILALAEQYLVFIREARRLRLDLAADYLVMASWLAWLKSRLLLPQDEDADEPTGEEMAAALAFRLQRLDAMREAAARLMARNRLGRDVFARGAPEAVTVVRTREHGDTLIDLLKAYSDQRVRALPVSLRITRAPVLAVEDARKRLERLIGQVVDWGRIDTLLPEAALGYPPASALASTFLASLELAKDGVLELRQGAPFDPIYLRRRPPDAPGP